MPDHPSIQGLREAAYASARFLWDEGGPDIDLKDAVEMALDSVASYLTEHGVGWFGEELVRASRTGTRDLGARSYLLVPVPQDGES